MSHFEFFEHGLNPNIDNQNNDVRNRERFNVNFARTQTYQMSAIPYCQTLLNAYFSQTQGEGGGGA